MIHTANEFTKVHHRYILSGFAAGLQALDDAQPVSVASAPGICLICLSVCVSVCISVRLFVYLPVRVLVWLAGLAAGLYPLDDELYSSNYHLRKLTTSTC